MIKNKKPKKKGEPNTQIHPNQTRDMHACGTELFPNGICFSSSWVIYNSKMQTNNYQALLRKDPRALMAEPLRMYWWQTAAARAPIKGPTQKIQCSSQALSPLKITAAPKLLAGFMPVPVMGIVARWTMNTANPIGSGANTFISHQLFH